MGTTYTPNKIVAGAWAQVWVNNELWAECTGITFKITEGRKDVQIGMDIGSKLVSLKGEGTITVDHVYTTKTELVKNKLQGKDTLVQIIAAVSDPDSVDGKIERWALNDAVFTETPLLDIKRGEMGTKSFPFTFPATKMQLLEAIA